MPRLGSQLQDFIVSGLVEDKYPNLKLRTIENTICTFSLEHRHKRNKEFRAEFFNIYEDYYALKKPGHPIPNSTKVKSMLDSALNRKGNRYIRFLRRDGNKFVYEMDNFTSRSNSSSPASSSSTSDEEPLGKLCEMEWKDDLGSCTALIFPDSETCLTLQPELFNENLFNSYTDYMDSDASSPELPIEQSWDIKHQSTKSSSPKLEVEENFLNEVLTISKSKEVGLFTVDPGSVEIDVQKNISGEQLSAVDPFFEDTNIGLETLPNGSVSLVNNSTFPTSNAFLQDEIANKENQLMQGINVFKGSNEDNAVIDISAAQIVPGHAVSQYALTNSSGSTAADLEHHNYCERSLEVEKVGNEYTFIFKTVCNTLPLNDPVFLYLAKMCSPA